MNKPKYEFKSIGLDDFELIRTKDGEKLPFTRTIEAMAMLENIEADARLDMIKYMKSKKMKKEDLIEKNVSSDGKITYDESYYREFENGFINKAILRIANDIYEVVLKRNLADVLEWLELSDENETYLFNLKFRQILLAVGKDATPCGADEQSPSSDSEI